MNSSDHISSGYQHRTARLLGDDNLLKLRSARVLLFGTGGVGSWCAEALVRTGILHLTIVDSDSVSQSNCNRQLMATSRTVGQVKVDALRERLLEINPEADIIALNMEYTPSTAGSFRLETYDYIIDAIDSLPEKADLILRATALPYVRFYSSMGAALRIDPFMIRRAEFWKVKGDALARALRNRFKREKRFPARKFTCIYSEEPPMPNMGEVPDGETAGHQKVQVNGSLCHITASFGMAIAGCVVEDIVNNQAGLASEE